MKRYDLQDGGDMIADPEGDWVKYEDLSPASVCSLGGTEQRLMEAEHILDQLADGYSRFMLNEMREGQQIGEQVISYWEKWSAENISGQGSA